MCCEYDALPWMVYTGQLVWRRHVHFPPPSHHDLRNTCMQLLPLVEMYCKWELEEDCTSLWALMVRFDNELELESHELGRSLLFMVRDETTSLHVLPQVLPPVPITSPFDIVKERLAAAGLAIQSLHHQVHYTSMSNFLGSTSFQHFNYILYAIRLTPCLQFALCLVCTCGGNTFFSIVGEHVASRTKVGCNGCNCRN